jgi:putative peptide zinc metalloprotease protein
MDLYVPDLFSREKILQARLDQQRWQAATSAFDEDMRKRWKVAEQNLQMTQVELQGVEAERHQFKPTAPFDGKLLWVDPDLAVGQWVGKKEPLVVLVQQGSKWRVETWLDEDDVGRVHLGNSAKFMTDSAAGHILNLTVTAIDRDAARVLPRRELASAVGGHVLTREKNGQLIPERAVYRVSMDVDVMPSSMQQQSWRGSVIVESDTQIPISRYARQVLSVLMREMGF